MLALVLTLLFAVYLLGPELFACWLLSIFFPAPVRVRDRGEEVSRTLFGSLIFVVPVACLEYFCAGHFHDFSAFRRFYSGLASPTALTAQENLFFASAWQILVENVRFLVVPVYLWVAIISLLRCYWAKNYGRLVAEWKDWPIMTAGISLLVKPATADWHLKLSGILLPKQNDIIQADVLTTLDILYRGRVTEHSLGPDGSLKSLTLTSARKFRREELIAKRQNTRRAAAIDPSDFWSPIQGNSLVIQAAEIVTININYVDPGSLIGKPKRVSQESAAKALRLLSKTDFPAQAFSRLSKKALHEEPQSKKTTVRNKKAPAPRSSGSAN